ncbi:ABC transporter substrate-binding protein [Weissella tructae]|uniref:Iron (Fe) ABC superfamily ATP binding cassette transporter, binding protein n=2 Tax=Weissella TaxID=46255 RepID=A0A075U740_9LACO|nr:MULTISPECIES: ABC transporter substrate-binding protein [Weissella]AIG65917.1 Iron (Fe) ABC superfamily ATP binding cassette transporter, binding protein [Weissella tructae]AIM63295.1 Iron (Fe) ABC superfamily ATP binding cassette transporter, binding protein [Weissella ceti]AIM64630.1 Iron (Fe) ABC superfamily ATP binding cassette transporter, binding protein [Weissella ceti]ELA07288.1 Heme ABC transporter, heme-binding protein isdE [Weissella ceti NC36]QVV91076.1 ABC transporter substrate
MSKIQIRLLSMCLILLLILIGGWVWLILVTNDESDRTTLNRVVTTTNAQTQVFDQLGIDQVVGVATPGAKQNVPNCYQDLPQVGNHISPNIEKIASLKPDAVYVDAALVDDYQQKLTSDHIRTEILDFKTVGDLQDSLTYLGETYGKTAEAKRLKAKLDLKDTTTQHHPKVLLLMGMPGGSFLAGTKYSYVGDLIERAGGNVITTSQAKSDYVQPNIEQIATEQPDVIITMAHAMEDSVFESFQAEFKSANWQTIKAVKEQHVYQAKEPTFSMTANMNAPKAFKQIQDWLAETQKN